MRKGDWQLVVFTIFVQMGLGIFSLWGIMVIFASSLTIQVDQIFKICPLVSLVTLIIGGLAATAHLSKPLRFGLSLANWKNSWLSREALFSVLLGVVILLVSIRGWLATEIGIMDKLLIVLGILIGFLLLLTISRLYMLRTVPVWNNPGTPITFVLSSLIFGLLILVSCLNLLLPVGETRPGYLLSTGMLGLFVLITLQLTIFFASNMLEQRKSNEGIKSVYLNQFGLQWLLVGRFGTAFLSLVILFFGKSWLINRPTWFVLTLSLIFLSEILGRVHFYKKYERVGY